MTGIAAGRFSDSGNLPCGSVGPVHRRRMTGVINSSTSAQPSRSADDNGFMSLLARILTLLAVGSMTTACSSRSATPFARDAAPVGSDAQAVPLEAPERLSFGSVERIRTRFDAECPRSMAAPDGSPGRVQDPNLWLCAYDLAKMRAGSLPGSVRRLALAISVQGRDSATVRRVEIAYNGPGSASPPECAQVIDEAVSYVADLRGLRSLDHTRLARLVRDNRGPGGDRYHSGTVAGQTVYFRSWGIDEFVNGCGVSLDADLSAFSPAPTSAPGAVQVSP